jgi:hypothetical protein
MQDPFGFDTPARLSSQTGLLLAIGLAFALILDIWFLRVRLGRWVARLHGGQVSLLLLPGVFALGFWREVLIQSEEGVFSGFGDKLASLESAGIPQELIAVAIVGVLMCLPIISAAVLWSWLGSKRRPP